MVSRRAPGRSSAPVASGAVASGPQAGATTADAGLEAVLEATRQLMWITTPAEAADVARTLIADLGGQIVPADQASTTDTLPVDVSFGQNVPLVPSAPPLSLARLLLERHLPSFMLDAQRALILGDRLSWLAADVCPQAAPRGEDVTVGRTAVAGEVTEQTKNVSARSRSTTEELLRTVLQTTPVGIALVSMNGRFRLVNRSLCDLLGYGEAWFLTHRMRDIIHPDDLDDVLRERQQVLAGSTDLGIGRTRLVRADGTAIWVDRLGVPIPEADGEPGLFLVQLQDVTAEHAAQEALTFQALHDPLTGLPNRARLLASLELDLHAAKRQGTSVGVLYVTLDNFKVVNGSLGHSAGDKVLKIVAARIVAAVRPEDHVGRFSGKDFLIAVQDVQYGVEIARCAERISASIAADLQVEGHRIAPTASIGIATSTSISTPDSLIRDASSALFAAKSTRGTKWQFFEAPMRTHAVARLTVEGQLRDAITAHSFVVHYQPIVSLADASVVGHEALVRWAHPTRGLLHPAEFLEVAEETGLITAIGAQVLEQVCATLAIRNDLPGPISVNVSAVELTDPGWLRSVRDTLTRYRIDPARIVIEVTETAVLSLVDSTQIALRSLRSLGVGLHVDDFGTGYSSISLLRDLPLTGVKLDLVFVHDLTTEDSQANALTRGLSGLVKGMHLTGVAEGVETQMQADLLAAQGWDCAQGFYFGRPGPLPGTVVQSGGSPNTA